MHKPISPSELPRWVPGRVLCASDALGWRDVAVRSYGYSGLDVEVPPLDHYVLVRYRDGSTHMCRRFDGRWSEADCTPGVVSLLSRTQASHWRWRDAIEVSHVYLSEAIVLRVAQDMRQSEAAQVQLHDRLRVEDPVLTGLVDALVRETVQQGPGGAMLAEALALQLSVHLLRDHAQFDSGKAPGASVLATARLRRVREYIDAHLHEALSINELAGVAGLGVCTFCRHFRSICGVAPHTFVMQQRLARAQRLLVHGDAAIKQVAATCGFADQAHLTRLLRAQLGTTPAQLRLGAGSPAPASGPASAASPAPDKP
jgi:AraC family transcriptional regulator